MNNAETRRNLRIGAMTDLQLLGLILSDVHDLTPGEYVAFVNMRNHLREFLSKKEREWAEEVARRVMPYDSKDAPRGREVPLPDVLRNLPKSPPGRR